MLVRMSFDRAVGFSIYNSVKVQLRNREDLRDFIAHYVIVRGKVL